MNPIENPKQLLHWALWFFWTDKPITMEVRHGIAAIIKRQKAGELTMTDAQQEVRALFDSQKMTEEEMRERLTVPCTLKQLVLAAFLDDGDTPDSWTPQCYNENVFRNGRYEYMVLTDSEADEAWDNDNKQLADESVLSRIPADLQMYFDMEKYLEDCKDGGDRGTLASYDGNENEFHATYTGNQETMVRILCSMQDIEPLFSADEFTLEDGNLSDLEDWYYIYRMN